MTVAVLRTNAVPKGEVSKRFRIGLTIASLRLLPDVQRCFRCHMLRHTAARCTVVWPGRDLCRRCESIEHVMNECTKEPRCAMCSKQEGLNTRHVMDSLPCPMVRTKSRRGRK